MLPPLEATVVSAWVNFFKVPTYAKYSNMVYPVHMTGNLLTSHRFVSVYGKNVSPNFHEWFTVLCVYV